MMARTDHIRHEPAGWIAITLGYQLKSVERHRFHMSVTSVLRSCAVLASLKTRSLLRFNHHSSPLSDRLRMKLAGHAALSTIQRCNRERWWTWCEGRTTRAKLAPGFDGSNTP